MKALTLLALLLTACCYTSESATHRTQLALLVNVERPQEKDTVSDTATILGGELGAYGLGSKAAMAFIGVPGAAKAGFEVLGAKSGETTQTKETK